MIYACQLPNGGSAPATPGFNAVAPERPFYGAADAAPAVPATESTLGAHPCVALSSAQLYPEWTMSTSPCNDFSSNGDNPLNFLSHSRGSLHPASAHSGPGARTALRFARADSSCIMELLLAAFSASNDYSERNTSARTTEPWASMYDQKVPVFTNANPSTKEVALEN
jgi:hypothetical protein